MTNTKKNSLGRHAKLTGYFKAEAVLLFSPVWFVPALTDLGIWLHLIWAPRKRQKICSREQC